LCHINRGIDEKLLLYNFQQIWATVGENTGLKVFRGDEESQCLPLPALFAWRVAALDNGDLVVGCSDGNVWVFLSEECHHADSAVAAICKAKLDKFKTELKGFNVTSKDLQTEMQKMQNEWKELFSEMSNKVDTLSGRVDALSNKVNTLSNKDNTLSNKVDTLSGRVDALSNKVNTLSGRVDDLEDLSGSSSVKSASLRTIDTQSSPSLVILNTALTISQGLIQWTLEPLIDLSFITLFLINKDALLLSCD